MARFFVNGNEIAVGNIIKDFPATITDVHALKNTGIFSFRNLSPDKFKALQNLPNDNTMLQFGYLVNFSGSQYDNYQFFFARFNDTSIWYSRLDNNSWSDWDRIITESSLKPLQDQINALKKQIGGILSRLLTHLNNHLVRKVAV